MQSRECIRPETRLTDEAVVLALRTLADAIEVGVPLEEIRPRFDLHTVYHEIELRVFDEVRWGLIQSRDYGSIRDRVGNGKGNVPWPARYLPPGTTPEGYFDITLR